MKYFGDDAVGDVGLDAIAELNGIGDGDREERLRGGRRSRALRGTGESFLLFHIPKQSSTCRHRRRKREKGLRRTERKIKKFVCGICDRIVITDEFMVV